MCGIVGYIGKKNNPQIGLNTLRRLEYRGYDSAGMAVFNPEKQEIFCLKAKGRIDELKKKFIQNPVNGNPFVLQTRWATHGKPSEKNAHPHWDCAKNIFLVHNGIIENYQELKEQLIKQGHKFISETDAEVICHLIEKYFKGNLEEAVRKALAWIRGTYGLAIIARDDPQKIVFARQSSPLLVGLGRDENFVASDAAAIIGHTKKVVYLDDGEIGVITADDFRILTLDNHKVKKETHLIEWEIEEAQKQGFSHFMLKEIH